jgi:hypothetical protein
MARHQIHTKTLIVTNQIFVRYLLERLVKAQWLLVGSGDHTLASGQPAKAL